MMLKDTERVKEIVQGIEALVWVPFNLLLIFFAVLTGFEQLLNNPGPEGRFNTFVIIIALAILLKIKR